jgi:RTA1 like protein
MVTMANDFSFEQKGLRIMQAGLAFQVASLLLFILLCIIFAMKCHSRPNVLDERFSSLRASRRFRIFLWCEYTYLLSQEETDFRLVGLSFATIFMLIRCTFRVAELSEGFHGHIWSNQIDYMVLEGAMVLICVLLLTFAHPGLGFCGKYHDADFKMRIKKSVLPENSQDKP